MPSTFSTSDLTPLLQAAPTAQMRYASGVIVSWNAESYENVIEVRGSFLINLPVLSGPDGLSYKAGDVVALIGADQQGARGIASYAILGRFLVPGAGRAEQSIEWMTSELGRSIAAAVFADRIKTAEIRLSSSGAPESPDWGNLADEPGPILSNVEVTETGKLIVLITSRFDLAGASGSQPHMAIDVQGPTPKPPDTFHALHLGKTTATTDARSARMTATAIFDDLLPGTYTITAKYRGAATFGGRRLVGIAL